MPVRKSLSVKRGHALRKRHLLPFFLMSVLAMFGVGYVVLTLRFGMEYGGLMACLDDLFVVPQSRNNGLTTAALVQVRDFCKSIGVRAITVEVSHSNGSAQTVYRRLGLAEAPDRQLLALALASPMHVI
jgi:GNAT superfamily N-acetyltransferase